MNIQLLRQELIRDEGLRTTAYRDSLGLWTIGVGHLLGPGDHTGLVWTPEHVEEQFQADVQSALAVAQSLPAYTALETDNRQRALVNMAYQMGGKLRTFVTFLSLLEQKKFLEAGEDLRTTLWFKQVPVRAARIIQMIERG